MQNKTKEEILEDLKAVSELRPEMVNFALGMVVEWADKRNFFHPTDGTTFMKQYLKLMEEYGEAAGNIAKSKFDKVPDDLGDMIVVLVVMCKLNGVEIKISNSQLSFSDREREYSREKIMFLLNLAITDFVKSGDKAVGVAYLICALEAIRLINLLARSFDLTIEECIAKALEDILPRKGKMVNRVYVKESDLPTN